MGLVTDGQRSTNSAVWSRPWLGYEVEYLPQSRPALSAPSTNRRGAKPPCADPQGAKMIKQRYWMAGAAVVAAVAAFPLTQPGQASAQPTKALAQTSTVPEQARVQPQVLNRHGQAVRVVYPSPVAPR
jgi:hypothetical protein